MQLAKREYCGLDRKPTLEPDRQGDGQDYRRHFVVDDRFHPVQLRVTIHSVSDGA